MKIVITGSASGLGLACKNLFADYELVELDRPQFDLTRNLDDFVSTDFDVYINNAYSNWAQVDLLYKLYELNKNRSCMIINIGSVSADGNYDQPNPYAVHKLALDHACKQLQLDNKQCRIVQFKLGRMNTPMAADKLGPKLDPNWVAEQIKYVISLPSNILPKTLVFDSVMSRG